MQMSAAVAGLRRVEAARQALLRRLGPALRERVASRIQPVGPATERLAAGLQPPAADPAGTEPAMRHLRECLREANEAALDLVTWIVPEAGRSVPLAEALAETAALLGPSFGRQGFALEVLPGAPADLVRRSTVRTLLPAALFALADGATPLAGIGIAGRITAEGPCVDLRLGPGTPAARRSGNGPLGWEAVALLARDDGVGLVHGEGMVSLHLPPG